ncbi:hypothetical protein GCM10022243_58120 [Saccharothrix violaceirubra]|uniref:Uncharacterized protein n=1 Tax=Saccharothrix violaceirubra TaxID=413306 RepID=A0A7W7T484_9PSEU|nr:hypothetical protein [Saccharothrix violaceirubra]MBB4965757.1 hypothetical protein [Saccharothrix violaceirubra]
MMCVESRTLREIGRCLATGRPHHALDHAFHLLGTEPHAPGRRFLLIAELAGRAGRPLGAAYYRDLARRTLPDGHPPIEIPDLPRHPDDARKSAMPPERAHYAMGRAEQALRWLDHRVTTSPFAHDWARTALLRETRASAHLDGVHLALIEVFHHVLSTSPVGQWREPAFARYLSATLGLFDTPTAPLVAEPLADVLTRHVRTPPATGHALRLALPVALVRARWLTRPWLPLSTHHRGTDPPRPRRADVLAAVGRIADALTRTCHAEIAVLDVLTRLHDHPAATRTRNLRAVWTDLLTRGAVTATDLATRHGFTTKTGYNTATALRTLGLARIDPRPYGRTIHNPDALHLLATSHHPENHP